VLVAEGNDILLSKGYGLADRERRVGVDERTRFNLASLTKAITATLILRLEADGVLKRTDRLGDLIPGVPDDKRAITVAQLLTHTGGIAWDALPSGRNLTRDQAREALFASRVKHAPGESFGYSNSGYQILALIAETRTGRSYADLVREHVFTKARMQDSGVVGEEGKSRAGIAIGYNEWTTLGSWRDWNDGWRPGSGNAVSTLTDVWLWHRALRDGRIIPVSAVRDMMRTQTAGGSAYGFGWFTGRSEDGDSLIAHGGDFKGYHNELRWYVERDLVIIVLSNLELYDESGSGLGLHKRVIASALANLAQGGTVEVPPAPVRASSKTPVVVGAYTVGAPGEGTLIVASDNRRLTLTADGQAAINAILRLNDPKLAECNRKTAALLAATASQDTTVVREVLGADAGFFIQYAFEERDEMIRRLGEFRSAEVCGTRPMPWDPEERRTFARLYFASGAIDYQHTWKGDSFYESISETGARHAVVLPLVLVEENTCVAWDIVGRSGARLGFTTDDGKTVLSFIEDANRVILPAGRGR